MLRWVNQREEPTSLPSLTCAEASFSPSSSVSPRGVNRGKDNPLEVQVLADVALPLVHDEVTTWDLVAPDVFQKMLIAGVAVDSPADSAALHPTLFGTSNQVKLAFKRAGFKGQTSYKDPIRGMTLKSAAYRRMGRGRSWQRVWWIEGRSYDARALLEAALAYLAEWQPELHV